MAHRDSKPAVSLTSPPPGAGGAAGTYAPWAARWPPTLTLVLAVTAIRLIYLAFACPYALAEDEAHYWEWSRHPAWSYYSKGPGVAWVIAASTRLLGTSEFSVRLPAAIFGAVTALALAGLARHAFNDRRAAFVAACLFMLTPFALTSGILMTIDSPYMACWALAAWAGWSALVRGHAAAWAALGAAIGAGFLFKYTIVLLVPGLAAFALAARHRLPRADPTWIAAGAGIAMLGLAPVLVWNAQHDWATVRHLLGHLGIRGGDMPIGPGDGTGWSPLWLLSLIGSQFGLLGLPSLLILFAVWESVRRAAAPQAHESAAQQPSPATPTSQSKRWRFQMGDLYLLCLAAPILLFYAGVSLIAEPEGNWPAAGHLSLLALASLSTLRGLDEYRLRLKAWRDDPARPWKGIFRASPQMPRQMVWRAAVIFGIVFGFGLLRLDLLARLPWVGPLIPIGRLTSARPVAAETQRVMVRLRDAGENPFVVAQHYGRASQLAFYLPGRPTVYCSSSRVGGRRTQHDYWPDTDLDDLALLQGRAAVLHGATAEVWSVAFPRVDPLGPIPGDHKTTRPLFIGHDYRGFPAPSADGERTQ